MELEGEGKGVAGKSSEKGNGYHGLRDMSTVERNEHGRALTDRQKFYKCWEQFWRLKTLVGSKIRRKRICIPKESPGKWYPITGDFSLANFLWNTQLTSWHDIDLI